MWAPLHLVGNFSWPLGKGALVPMAQSKPQQWVNSDLCKQYCWHKLKLIHVVRSTRKRVKGYGAYPHRWSWPFPGSIRISSSLPSPAVFHPFPPPLHWSYLPIINGKEKRTLYTIAPYMLEQNIKAWCVRTVYLKFGYPLPTFSHSFWHKNWNSPVFC